MQPAQMMLTRLSPFAKQRGRVVTRKSAAKWQNKVFRLFPSPCPGIFCKAGISNFNQFSLEASRVISLYAWSFYHGLLWDVFNKSKQWHVKIQPIAQSTIFGEFVTLCSVTSPWWLVMMRMMSRCMLTRDRVAHASRRPAWWAHQQVFATSRHHHHC